MLTIQLSVISKLVETKTNSKYQIEYIEKVIRPLVLIFPKWSGYFKTSKVKGGVEDKTNKLISFRIDDEKLLGKNKPIWTKNENLKMLT